MRELKFEGNSSMTEIAGDDVQFTSFETEPPCRWSSHLHGKDKAGHTCCPDCGGGMVRLGSCFSCPSCGYQSCG